MTVGTSAQADIEMLGFAYSALPAKLHPDDKPMYVFQALNAPTSPDSVAPGWWLWPVGGAGLLAPYFWQFGFRASVFSPSASDWANFGSYVSGSVGVVAAAANVWAVYSVARLIKDWGSHEAKQKLAFDLFTEWTSASLRTARDQSSHTLRDSQGSRFVELDENRDPRMSNLYLVAAFFHRVDALLEAQLLYARDIRQLFGPIYAWWWRYCFCHWPSDWTDGWARYRRLHRMMSADATEYEKWDELARRAKL